MLTTQSGATRSRQLDKTGIAIDGPDADSDTPSTRPTPISAQDIVAAGAHANGQSWQRYDLTEGTEAGTGGNGTGGDDGTSEDTSDTWSTAAATPGAGTPPPALPDIPINEVDADTPSTDTAEFIELYDGGIGNVALDGLSAVLYNGSDDLSYTPAFDLDGYSTDADGYFIIGSVPGADIYATLAEAAGCRTVLMQWPSSSVTPPTTETTPRCPQIL